MSERERVSERKDVYAKIANKQTNQKQKIKMERITSWSSAHQNAAA